MIHTSMRKYVVLLRGINVGGRNRISMAELRRYLEEQGCENVITYIQSGNVLLQSALDEKTLGPIIEKILSENFELDSSIIKVLVLPEDHLKAIIDQKPQGFGVQPDKYHSDVIYLMDIDTAQAMSVFNPKEGVDQLWPGKGVIYHQRLSALRTKSRLNRIMGMSVYKSMTVRNWNTTEKLLKLLQTSKTK